MKKEVLIVFPSLKQISYLNTIQLNDFKIYIILQNSYNYSENHCTNIVFVKKDDMTYVEILKNKKLAVLCCHEEAIYWLRIHKSYNWELQFNELYLSLLEKHHFKEFVQQKNVSIAKYTLNIEEIDNYPIIAKPTIGFGSIGVQTLNNRLMCEEYIKNFNQMIDTSGIHKYQEIYFLDKSNTFIFETPINGEFYRTPFIVESGVCKYVFPVRGISKLLKKASDYHWVEFEYNLSEPVNKVGMESIVKVLIKEFSLADGTYVAEFIQNSNKELYLLEFSPRQTSERIGHVIFLATGIDIELETLSMFLKEQSFQNILENKQIRLRIERSNTRFKPLKQYTLIEENCEYSVYDDKILCKYYEKMKTEKD